MTEWSEDTKRQTISDLTYKTYMPNGENVYFKHVSGLFGYMLDDDVMKDQWCLSIQSGDGQVFHSLQELVTSGWVLD